ncbi:1,4-dihydroxy-2-naphthoate polyprenyltransferase, partial [Bacillus cereus]
FLGWRKPISAIQSFQKGAKDPGYMRIAMKSTAMTNTIFGFLLSAGLLISYLF